MAVSNGLLIRLFGLVLSCSKGQLQFAEDIFLDGIGCFWLGEGEFKSGYR